MSGGGLREALHLVSEFVVSDAALSETLQQIAELTKSSDPNAIAVGMTLVDDHGRASTAVYTDPVSPAVDKGQYDDGAGPCIEAYRDNRVVVVSDVVAEAKRWPSFVRLAREHGVGSTLSLPLSAGDHPSLGAMNLYAADPGSYTDDDLGDARLLASCAAAVLANAKAYWEVFDLASGLRTAMESRAIIEQAKGKIMATSGCTADEAFQVLVAASQRENVKLRDVAKRMVHAEVLPSDL